MKKKSLLKFIVVIVIAFCSTSQIVAQEVEVTGSELYLRSANNYGVLKFYNTGELLLNKVTSSSNLAFTINVANSNNTAFRVIQNWGSNIFEVLGTGTLK